MSETKTTIITIEHKPKPGWPCPHCHGAGNIGDGSVSGGTEFDVWGNPVKTEWKFTRPTPCYLCKGKGRVKVEALNDNEG